MIQSDPFLIKRPHIAQDFRRKALQSRQFFIQLFTKGINGAFSLEPLSRIL
jgi:hypothetical protein